VVNFLKAFAAQWLTKSDWTRPPPPAPEEGIGQVVEEGVRELGYGWRLPGTPVTLFHRFSPEANVAEGGWSGEETPSPEGTLDPELSEPTVLWPQTRDQTPVEGANSPELVSHFPNLSYLSHFDYSSPYISELFGEDMFYTPEFVSPTSSENFGGDSFYTISDNPVTPSLGDDGEFWSCISSPGGCETPPPSLTLNPPPVAEVFGVAMGPLPSGILELEGPVLEAGPPPLSERVVQERFQKLSEGN
jgi:hypothetical protein